VAVRALLIAEGELPLPFDDIVELFLPLVGVDGLLPAGEEVV
jgi:hypothetical protein